ncbi:MAG: hypothetical protein V3U84_08955 [Thiotrichaceae bacterium]
MENYIVRIYRRDDNETENVVGMLENVETQQQQPFHDLVTLTKLLSGQGDGDAWSTAPENSSPLSPLVQATSTKAG